MKKSVFSFAGEERFCRMKKRFSLLHNEGKGGSNAYVSFALIYNSGGVFYQLRDIRDVDWS